MCGQEPSAKLLAKIDDAVFELRLIFYSLRYLCKALFEFLTLCSQVALQLCSQLRRLESYCANVVVEYIRDNGIGLVWEWSDCLSSKL